MHSHSHRRLSVTRSRIQSTCFEILHFSYFSYDKLTKIQRKRFRKKKNQENEEKEEEEEEDSEEEPEGLLTFPKPKQKKVPKPKEPPTKPEIQRITLVDVIGEAEYLDLLLKVFVFQ